MRQARARHMPGASFPKLCRLLQIEEEEPVSSIQLIANALRIAWRDKSSFDVDKRLMSLVSKALATMLQDEVFCAVALHSQEGPMRHPLSGRMVWVLSFPRLQTTVRAFWQWGDVSLKEREHIVMLLAAALATELCQRRTFVMDHPTWDNRLSVRGEGRM